FTAPAPTETYTLSLHDALPIFGQVQAREDAAVDDASRLDPKSRRRAGRNCLGRVLGTARELEPHSRGGVPNLVDHQELAVAPVAEALLEDVPGPFGVRSRHGEGVLEEWAQPGTCVAADQEDNEPEA